MTHANLRVHGSQTGRSTPHAQAVVVSHKFAGTNRGVVALAALAVILVASITGCASSNMRLESPACETMRTQITEKQKLDAEVKALGKQARDLRKKADTTAAVAAEKRLEGLVEQQRYLKDALDQTSLDCAPGLQDAQPPLDPAVREKQRLEGK